MKILLLLFFIVVSSFNLNAQVNNYLFNISSGTYSEITGGTLIAAATGTSGNAAIDDVVFPGLTIPFNFNLNGVILNTLDLSSNGFITVGGVSPTGIIYNPISNPLEYSRAISALGRDLIGYFRTTGIRTIGNATLSQIESFTDIAVGKTITGTGIPAGTTITAFDETFRTITMSAAATSSGNNTSPTWPTGQLRTQTIQTAPNRIFVIQWKGFSKFGITGDNLNFQIRLYETNFNIEFAYGTFNIISPTNGVPQVGLRGSTNSDFNNLTGINWALPLEGQFNSDFIRLNSSSFPLSGTRYIFTPPPQFANDVGVTDNLAPIGTVGGCSIPLAPKARVGNFGTNNQTTPFQVTYNITGPVGYTSTKTTTVLSIQQNTIIFDSIFIPNTVGNYNVKIYTRLASDQNPNNDTLKTSFTVSTNPNYGGGETSHSRYFFANSTPCGIGAPNPPTFTWKDTTGSISLIVNGALAAGGGILSGTLDDGYFKLGNILPPGYKFKFCDVEYDSFFIATNGMIGMSEANNTERLKSFSPSEIPAISPSRTTIFALWKDLDFTDIDVPVNRLSYKVNAAGNELLFTYDRAPNYNVETDVNDYVSFQVILKIFTNPITNRSFLCQYDNSRTGSTFLNKYFDLSLAEHTVGLQNQDGTRGVQYRRSAGGGIITSTGPIFASPVAVMYTPNVAAGLILNLTSLIEGFYNIVSDETVRDTIRVYLRNTLSPYSIIDSAKGYFDIDGKVSLNFLGVSTGTYYLQLRHRNGIETWSAAGVAFSGGILTYDFTSASSQAFGNNIILKGTKFCIYSGDVNQDGTVDLTDAGLIENDALNFVSGYTVTDVNGDETVDISDAAIADNNGFNFVSKITPSGPGPQDPFDQKNTRKYKNQNEVTKTMMLVK